MDLKFISVPSGFTKPFQPGSPVEVTGEFTRSLQPTKADLDEVGKWLAERVRERTLSGTDVEGKEFGAYSPAYEGDKGSSQVDLFSANTSHRSRQMSLFDYHMLDNIQEQVIGFSPNAVLEVGLLDNPALEFRGRMLQEGWQPRGHVGKRYRKGKDRGKFRRRPARRPAREWLGASEEDKIQMRNLLEESIAQRIGRGGV